MQTLVPFHTFNLNASASNIIPVASSVELKAVLASLGATPYLVLGEGSNTVFLEDYQGTVLKMSGTGISLQQRSDFFMSLPKRAKIGINSLSGACNIKYTV
ncbi:hypothetical protein RS130_03270 [Paraglaciecola aquimarina]|uniref:UDP-N-acetylmuramate dehydrogenase n=1 Tax=Paraglaciecola aquimarina TaxID=1235557 RepID=A0ABU3SST3_9ALTE|nr:hypothetical protein [Paraglaciecola aquimarina]MDU0353078.1 hypothetical protein [Paraglaciecola aquimarina]